MLRSPHKILAGAAVVLVVLMFVVASGHHKPAPTVEKSQGSSVSGTQIDTASVDNDSEAIKELIVKYDKLAKQNEAYQALLNKKMAEGQQNITKQNNNANEEGGVSVEASLAATEAKLEAMQAQLKQMGEQGAHGSSSNQMAHTGTGINNPAAYPVGQSGASSGLLEEQGMTTLVLDEDTPVNGKGQSGSPPLPTSTLPALSEPHSNQDKTQDKPETKIPFYTIPALSNLANTVLMTSLIGEVPQGNTFQQPPFPFLALVGKHDLLAANGIHLPPHIAGMKLAGYSVGVGSFLQGYSCTRSYITKALFVFDDGHFVVYGKDPSGDNVDPSDTLGYLSDPYGNPCMEGKYITNAARVLAMLTGVSMVEGAGEGLQQAQTNTMTGFNGSTTVFNGTVTKYAVGSGMSTSMDKASSYMLDRLKGTFDVVYIPASKNGQATPVVANFTKTIPIDYNLIGREIQYEHYGQRQAAGYQQGLD